MGRVYKSIDVDRLAAAVETINMVARRLKAEEGEIAVAVAEDMVVLSINGVNGAVGVTTSGALTLPFVGKPIFGDSPGLMRFDTTPVLCNKFVVYNKNGAKFMWCTADGLIDSMAAKLAEFWGHA